MLALILLGACAQPGFFIDPPNPLPLPQADAIVLLGGGWEYRERRTLELLRLGLAPRVLMTGVGEWNGLGMPARCPAYDYLRGAGVAAEAILADGKAKNTWEEIVWIMNMAQRNGWKTLLIVSDPPHLRRLAWVCRKVLENHGIAYRLVPTRPDWWQPYAGWANPSAARFVAFECLKLTYYSVRYAWVKP